MGVLTDASTTGVFKMTIKHRAIGLSFRNMEVMEKLDVTDMEKKYIYMMVGLHRGCQIIKNNSSEMVVNRSLLLIQGGEHDAKLVVNCQNRSFDTIWRFPQSQGYPPVIIHFERWDVPMEIIQLWGQPHSMSLPLCGSQCMRHPSANHHPGRPQIDAFAKIHA